MLQAGIQYPSRKDAKHAKFEQINTGVLCALGGLAARIFGIPSVRHFTAQTLRSAKNSIDNSGHAVIVCSLRRSLMKKKSWLPICCAFLATLAVTSFIWAQEGKLPQPKPVALESKSTAILALDLSARCDDPKQICSKLVPAVGEFLEKARAASVLIIHTASGAGKGTPLGVMASALKRRQDEPLLYPDAFDKFYDGELQKLLKEKDIKNLIITGASTNVAVLYTATTAARIYRYNVVIPIDGVIAASSYEQQYSFHQFTVLPGNAARQFKFTRLSMIEFQK